MDKFYVIKNKKGLYYAEGAWTNIVDVARKYNTREDAEERVNSIITAPLSNCEVIEIPSIADLEAKLAESESKAKTYAKEIVFLDKKLENLNKEFELTQEHNEKTVEYWQNECSQLKQQLAEKDDRIALLKKSNISLADDLSKLQKYVTGLQKELEESKHQTICAMMKKDLLEIEQNQTAIDELEKVKGWMNKSDDDGYIFRFASMDTREKFNQKLDQQIKSLKGETNEH